MFNRSVFTASLDGVFSSFQKSFDYPMTKSRLANQLSSGSALKDSERRAFVNAVADHFIALLEKEDTEPPSLSRDEKIGIYIDVLATYPDILEQINRDFASMHFRHAFSKACGIPALAQLRKRPELSKGLNVYVASYIAEYPAALPFLIRELQGTPEFTHIDNDAVTRYSDSFALTLHPELPEEMSILRAHRPLWESFQQSTGGASVFAVYTPPISAKKAPTPAAVRSSGFGFHYAYNEDLHIMTLDYDGMKDERGMFPMFLHTFSLEEMQNYYVLMNNALEIIKGNRPGALGSDPKWMAAQTANLMPALQEDIDYLCGLLKALKEPVPFTPRALIPA